MTVNPKRHMPNAKRHAEPDDTPCAAFGVRRTAFRAGRPGITLLLVILILSALLSISVSIFEVIFGEFRLSGEMTDSFTALYAADEGLEELLFNDRVADTYCAGPGSCTFGPVKRELSSGGCVTIRLNRTGSDTTLIATGEYRCEAPGVFPVKRALQTTYEKL